MTDDFIHPLLPVRFRRPCVQRRAAIYYWLTWECMMLSGRLRRRGMAADGLCESRRELNAALRAVGWTTTEIHALAVTLRRHAIETQQAEQARDSARQEAVRVAFESGAYDRTNVLPFRRAG